MVRFNLWSDLNPDFDIQEILMQIIEMTKDLQTDFPCHVPKFFPKKIFPHIVLGR